MSNWDDTDHGQWTATRGSQSPPGGGLGRDVVDLSYMNEAATNREDIDRPTVMDDAVGNRAATEPIAPARELAAPPPLQPRPWSPPVELDTNVEEEFFLEALPAEDPPEASDYPASYLVGATALGAVVAAAIVMAVPGPTPTEAAPPAVASTVPVNEAVVAAILTGTLAPGQERRALEYLAFVHTDETIGAWARQQLLPADGAIPTDPRAPVPATEPELAASVDAEEPSEVPVVPASQPRATPMRAPRPAPPRSPPSEAPVAAAPGQPAARSAPKPTAPEPAAHPDPMPDAVAMPAPGLDEALQKLQALRPTDLKKSDERRRVSFPSIEGLDFDPGADPIENVLTKARPGIEGCWHNAAASVPLGSGEVVVAFSVARGDVQDIRIDDDEIGSEDLERCMLRRLGRMRFDKEAAGEAIVTIAFD